MVMKEMLLGVSHDFLYYQGNPPVSAKDIHRPYCLVFSSDDTRITTERDHLVKQWKEQPSHSMLSQIVDIGDIETYRSFSDFTKTRKLFKVYTEKSFLIPEVSNYLFFQHHLYTAEHDIPYHQRVLVDIAASKEGWLFDTNGVKKQLKLLVYDIETTQFQEGATNVPIDIIGYTHLSMSIESFKDLATEEFSFDIVDIPSDAHDIDVHQLVSPSFDEEIDHLCKFCKVMTTSDLISGHNILGFDNLQIYTRVLSLMETHKDRLSPDELATFHKFLSSFARVDKSFHFGIGSEVVQCYPATFDTYLAARKFYPDLDSFGLKEVAPFLGAGIKNRLILTPSQIKIDARTLRYNKHDVQEQVGVTLSLIQQALPLAFTTCMPFDMLLSSGAVHMWDHMALIRGAFQKKIMPPICRTLSIAQSLCRDFKGCHTKEDIVKKAWKQKDQLSKEFIRVVKYGDEMPEWTMYPSVIFNDRAPSGEDKLNYHMPGGMTIKPDKDAKSHFVPWWYVLVADVGAMYPTILKAMNIGADTVKLTPSQGTPDEWIWLKKLPPSFLQQHNLCWKDVSSDDSYADTGHKLGITIDKVPGVINCAMTGIMSMIAKIKKELKEVQKEGATDELRRLKIMYQSVKGARNAGTHGILAAPTVSGRQFNLWGAAAITTKGQAILADTLHDLEGKHIRVVYGDTDGIYLGCSRSAKNLPRVAQSLGISYQENPQNWLTTPDQGIKAIKEANEKWQKNLQYPEFELEPEIHDAMIFVKHKNYLIFDVVNGSIEMTTKGNNFKGSDKANIARKILKQIMIGVLKENYSWVDEQTAREGVKNSITKKTQEILRNLDLSEVDLDDLTLVQSVQPASRYKRNQDGSLSTFAKRVKALEEALGHPIKSRIKLKFVVTKKPLPGIKNPSKSGVKPIDYMYPVSLLRDTTDIDLQWYKSMIENYIRGAFGLSEYTQTEQKGLDAWM
jgi:DNA polymerase elongation subunit (family B)